MYWQATHNPYWFRSTRDRLALCPQWNPKRKSGVNFLWWGPFPVGWRPDLPRTPSVWSNSGLSSISQCRCEGTGFEGLLFFCNFHTNPDPVWESGPDGSIPLWPCLAEWDVLRCRICYQYSILVRRKAPGFRRRFHKGVGESWANFWVLRDYGHWCWKFWWGGWFSNPGDALQLIRRCRDWWSPKFANPKSSFE